MYWLLLIVLGLITYLLVQRSVARITRTPVWILWLVLMLPAIIWGVWITAYGEKTQMPPGLMFGSFALCSVLYWLLIQWGRVEPSEKTVPETEANGSEDGKSATPALPLRPIDTSEEERLKNCFPWSIYYLEKIEYLPQAVVCKGKLRSNPEEAYKTIRGNIEQIFDDRFFIIFQESFGGKPFFALVPNPQAKSTGRAREPITRPGIALLLLLLTLLTTTLSGADFAGVTAEKVQANPAVLLQGLPYALALVAILGIHEFGHYLTAKAYKIRTTLPYFIPVPFFLGTFGAFIQMRSPSPHRKALFDVGIAGPIAGLVATIPVLLWGLAHSEVVKSAEASGLLSFNALNPRFSVLLTLFSKWALGSQLTPQTAIDLHPVAYAGYIGLLVTALNLMPVGQLDGGHIVHAMFGQKNGAAIGQITRILVLILALVHPGLLPWAIILLFMPLMDEPALNDVTELDNGRDFLGLLSLAILIAILLPVPPAISQWLNV
jgi:membrane-associated protease RseP (regulator of RpoE activity)